MASAQKTSKTYQLSLARRVGYGIGDFGINMFSTVVGSFLTAYYTDSVLLGAIFVGNTYTASILLFFGGNQQGYFGMSILYTAMTLEQKVGQLFCVNALNCTDEILDNIFRILEPGGVMYRAVPMETTTAFTRKLSEWAKIPLLIAGNLEKGAAA